MKAFIFFMLVGLSLCDKSPSESEFLKCVKNALKNPKNITSVLIPETCSMIDILTNEPQFFSEKLKAYALKIGAATRCPITEDQVDEKIALKVYKEVKSTPISKDFEFTIEDICQVLGIIKN